MRASTSGHRSNVAPLQLDADLGQEIRVFLEHLADQCIELLHVAAQGLQHLGVSAFGALRAQLQDPRSQRNGIQRRSQIVRHEGEILFPALLHFERLLRGEGLHGRSDRPVQDAVEDVERFPLQGQTIALREIVNAAAQDVVLRDDFLDVERFLDPLQTMRRRAARRLAPPGSSHRTSI